MVDVVPQSTTVVENPGVPDDASRTQSLPSPPDSPIQADAYPVHTWRYSRSKARWRVLLLLMLDATVLLCSIRFAEYMVPVHTDWDAHRAVMTGSCILMLHLFGFYRVRHVYAFHQRTYEIAKAVAFSMVATSGIFFTLPDVAAPRSLVWMAAFPTLFGLVFGRTLYHRLLPLRQGLRRVLVVGTGSSSRFVIDEIARNSSLGFEVVGIVRSETEPQAPHAATIPVMSGTSRLKDWVTVLGTDTVVVALDHEPDSLTAGSIGDCVELGCEVMTVARLTERTNRRIPVRYIGVDWFIRELNESNRQLYQTAKRALDILLSLAGLLATCVILPAIALAIRSDGPGPIFYSQVRVGHLGHLFRIYKFRSMRPDAERDGAVWASPGDQRVTKVGRFLRQSRIDELPQLLNVLLGDMSLVGPRPERPEFVSLLAEGIPHYNRRHMVVPGVTGWAQVNYPYGASMEDALEKLQYDLYYIKNRSLFLDVEILLRTVSIVLRKIGAR